MDFQPKRWNTYQLFSLLFSSLCACGHHGHAATSEKNFKKLTSTNYGSERLDLPWTDMSLAGCMTRCITRYSSQCQSFMYNSKTGLCTPGSSLQSGSFGAALAPNGTEGDLFAPSTCDTSDGFTYVTSADESACIMASDLTLDFHAARDYCLNLGALLFVGRTLEKYAFIPKEDHYFIGLTDLAVEGKFVWEDNGEEITREFQNIFFKPDEPNNSNNEDCVQASFKASTGLLNERANDCHCSSTMRFVCERPLV